MYSRLIASEQAFRNAWRNFQKRRRSSREYNVLGLCSTGHGASVALISSMHGVRALNLDRFLRKKYAVLFSRAEYEEIQAQKTAFAKRMRYLLSDFWGRFPPTMVFEEGGQAFIGALLKGTGLGLNDIDLVVTSECHFVFNSFRLGRKLRHYFPNAAIVTTVEHHSIHQFQAFFSSPFEESAVLTIDNCGEPLLRKWGAPLAITLASAHDTQFKVLKEHMFPHSSPGLLYHRFTNYLGFREGEEGKTMGLSSYGRDCCYRALVPHLKLHEDGSFRFLTSDELRAALTDFGAKPRPPGAAIEPIHGDVALAGQRLLDDIVTNAVQALEHIVPSRNLCIAGGVGLNSVTNEKAFRRSRFERVHIMPNAGDCGQALGCALYGARVLMADSHCRGIATDSLGPPYTDEDILTALRQAGLTARPVPDLPMRVAKRLADGAVVGWFQGGSEYGPRALGYRSILADCRPASMKDHLNGNVKRRESFRPYAPAVLEEKASEWFDLQDASPFMLRVVDVRPEKRSLLAGVTHVDGTARVQTVRRSENPLFYDLIQAFESYTGVPVILNTSFNRAGEPIVETPDDAIQSFLAMKIDFLIMHHYLVEKPD